MASSPPSSNQKWSISIFSAFLFFLVINPFTYKLTQSIFGGLLGKIADASGSPTMTGILLHTVVFLLIVRVSMGA
jgi:hypothetical protein